MKYFAIAVATSLGLAACQPATTDMGMKSMDPLKAALAGKTLKHESGSTVIMNADGTMGGKEADGRPLAGTWHIKDGKFCRTITQPERWAGSACQQVKLDGKQATFVRDSGSSVTYTIQ